MVNFVVKNTSYTPNLGNNAVGTGMSGTTILFGNSAESYQTPVITSTAAECMEASGRCLVKTNTVESKQQSLEQYADNLRKQGKIEGKDFKIESSPMYDNYNLYEYDGQGHEIRTNYWCGGNQASNKSGYDINEYNNGVLISKSYSNDDDLRVVDEHYPNVRKEDSEEAKLLDTNSDDYCKSLEAQGKVKNKDYKVEKETKEYSDGTKQVDVFLEELSPRGVLQKRLWWIFSEYGNSLSVSYCDKNGREKLRKTYNSDGTSSIAHYTENFCKH